MVPKSLHRVVVSVDALPVHLQYVRDRVARQSGSSSQRSA